MPYHTSVFAVEVRVADNSDAVLYSADDPAPKAADRAEFEFETIAGANAMSEKMKAEIRKYIIKEYIEDEDEAEDLDDETELIDSGLIDSFSITSIRNWLEKKYDVKIPDELGTVENFATIEKIVELVEDRQDA